MLVDRDIFLEAGQCLVALSHLWQPHDWKLPPDVVQNSIDLYARVLSLTEQFPEMQIPKRHLAMHLVKETGFLGNPRWTATWFDEALNKVLKMTCRTVSQATFDVSVLSSMRLYLQGKFRLD